MQRLPPSSVSGGQLCRGPSSPSGAPCTWARPWESWWEHWRNGAGSETRPDAIEPSLPPVGEVKLELGFFRNEISLSLAEISASKWQNGWSGIAENPNRQLQEHTVSNTYESDGGAFLPSVKWLFLWWYIWKACLILLPLCVPCTITIPTLRTNMTLWLHWNSFSVKCLSEWNTANIQPDLGRVPLGTSSKFVLPPAAPAATGALCQSD